MFESYARAPLRPCSHDQTKLLAAASLLKPRNLSGSDAPQKNRFSGRASILIRPVNDFQIFVTKTSIFFIVKT
jgi:hypothetical protein